MKEDGYLYLPGFFNTDLIQAARQGLLERMADAGMLDPEAPLMEGRVLSENRKGFSPELATNNPQVQRVVRGPELLDFYSTLLGGEVRSFDFVWVRSMPPGSGTPPHCDIVFMGRGTSDLYTAWIPYGPADFEIGGLMVLEDSHKKGESIQTYLEHDVDTYCENTEEDKRPWKTGQLSDDPRMLREKLGGRWLTAEFQPGDLLTFGMGTVHASLDNRSENRLRLSTDTRYQLASEPVDERWVGENPKGHGKASAKGMIC